MKAIVYGLGHHFNEQRFLIENEYDIVAYVDKKLQVTGGDMIVCGPDNIPDYDYDFIYITTTKYLEEIMNELHENYHIPFEKMVSEKDMWWYTSNPDMRHEWVARKLLSLEAGMKLLDAGAGNQRYRKYCAHLDYISQDFGEYDDSNSDEGIQTEETWKSKECHILSDIIDIPVPDKSFDVVLCTEVLEHIKNPISAVKEFSRILRWGGRLLLTAPFCSLTHMAPFFYSSGLSQYWYKDSLRDFGFIIDEITPYGNWFEWMAQEMKRFPSMAERYGKSLGDTDQKKLIDMLYSLMSQSKIGAKSEETLCFGYFIEAHLA